MQMSSMQAVSAPSAPASPVTRDLIEAARASDIRLVTGNEARALLGDPGFQDRYRQLYERCPWSTRFQSLEFLAIWYESYASEMTPVMICQGTDDYLTAAFPLAIWETYGWVICAGSHHAEYQCWLADPESSDAFLDAALGIIRSDLGAARFFMRYLPANAPIDWARKPSGIWEHMNLKVFKRPIFAVKDQDEIEQSLKKKSNKSRLNRLKKIGDVELRYLETKEELAAVIDRIADHYDLRQGALNGLSPFRLDPLKKPFHVELMRHPGLMDAGVLMVGEEVAAAILAIRDGNLTDVGVYAYASALSKHSPGKFLMLMLAQELLARGLRGIDLTPGDDWKDRFATEYEDVHQIKMIFDADEAKRKRQSDKLSATLRRVAAIAGLTPDEARAKVRRIRGYLPPAVIRRAKAALHERNEIRIYYFDTRNPVPAVPGFARDDLDAMLSVDREYEGDERQRFLSDCERRLGEGHHIYTRMEDGLLAQFGWLAPEQSEGGFPEVGQTIAYPANTAVIYDLSLSKGVASARDCLLAMLADAAPQSERVAIAVPADDVDLRLIVEGAGFKPAIGLFSETRFGKTRQWREDLA